MAGQRPDYDLIAGYYIDLAQLDGGFLQRIRSTMVSFIGDVAGQRVYDLACGEGSLAFQLATDGADVIGVDLSSPLIAAANHRLTTWKTGAGGSGNVRFIRADIRDAPDLFRKASGDGVVCHLALMDIEDLASAVCSVRSLLRTGGWFATSITHPCFQTPDAEWCTDPAARRVRSYFVEGMWWPQPGGQKGVRSQVGAHHRTLSTYLNCMISYGLRLDRVAEPRLDDFNPGYLEVPPFLLLRLTALSETG